MSLLTWLGRSGPVRSEDVPTGLAAAALEGELLVVSHRGDTWYAARRPLPGVVAPVAVYEIGPDGDARHVLTLSPVEPFGYWVESRSVDVEGGFFGVDHRVPGPDPSSDLPWFLLDLKPAGFLGRAWLRDLEDPDLPADLTRWSGDHTLLHALRHGHDLPGALLVGDPSAHAEAIGQSWGAWVGVSDPSLEYPPIAAHVLSGTQRAAGSTAGGEQPKFTVVRTRAGVPRHCLVKFSPPIDTPGGRRWADLLVAEHLAHEVVREHGIDAARSSLIDAGGRRFLEVERFDRYGETGRSGLVSLWALDTDGVASELRRWSAATGPLVAEGRLSGEDHERVRWLEAFGHMIANNDMHTANLSFRMRGTTLVGLAPVYDMLPMFHAPRHGELPVGIYDPRGELDAPPGTATSAARSLWSRVLERDDVSDGFKAIAAAQLALLRPGR